jgi:peptide/nickel transport system substrate-binding protein
MRLRSGSRGRSRIAPRRAAALCIIALLLAGCPERGGDGGGNGVRPVGGGRLTVAYPYEPTTLNPFVTGGDSLPTRDLVRPLMPALYRIGPRGARTPWLLAAEPAAADVGGSPFGVRLRLRADAVWSDGAPITATDVRYTWLAIMRSPRVATRDGYDRLSDVSVEGPKEFRLVFKQPFARWRDLFSAGLGVLPQHMLRNTDISKALTSGWAVSGGPYVLKRWTAGLEMVLTKNPRAWGGAPLLDEIRIQFVPDPITALALYARGSVDALAPYFAPDFARRAEEARDGSRVTRDVGGTWAGLFLNTSVPQVRDARVRQAIAYSINRPAIAEGLVRDEGEVLDAPSGGDQSRVSPAYSRYTYEPARGESLLDAAGWKAGRGGKRRRDGRELTFTLASVGTDDLAQRVLRAMNVQAAAVGIELNLVSLNSDELWGSWINGSRFQAALLIERDPPGGGARGRFGLAGPRNLSRLSDGTLGRSLDAADRTLADTAPAVAAPFDRIAALVPVLPLFRLKVAVAARRGVHEMTANASADGFLWNCERWWIDPSARSSPSGS